MGGQDMTDYSELVKALRSDAGNQYTSDAAAAIEALQAEVDALAHDIKRYVRINAELHAELEKWVSAAEKAGEPKQGERTINPYESTWAIENGYI